MYASASRQCINLEKSSVYFSGNTLIEQKNWIKNSLGVKEVDRFETYLGLSTLVGQAKYHSFTYIKDREWKKLQGWKGKMLSRVGKEVLIKVVAQSILTQMNLTQCVQGFGGGRKGMRGRFIGQVGAN